MDGRERAELRRGRKGPPSDRAKKPSRLSDPRVSAAVLDILNERVRNLVRGALASRSELVFRRTMESIGRECGPEDAELVARVLQESFLANYQAGAEAFPQSGQPNADLPYYESSRLEVELAAQRVRLEREQDRLLAAIDAIARLNRTILAADWEAASLAFDSFAEDYGASLIVAYKAIGVRSAIGTGATKIGAKCLTPFNVPHRQVATAAFEDTADRARDFLKMRRSYLGFVLDEKLLKNDAAITTDLLSPLEDYGFDVAQKVQAYGRRGVVDTAAALFRFRAVLTRAGRLHEAALVQEALPPAVRTGWRGAFGEINATSLQDVLGREDQFFDLAFLAHLPAWSEYEDLFEYRLDIEEAIGRRLDGRFPIVSRSAAAFAAPLATVAELVDFPPADPPAALRRVPGDGFQRTIALLSSVEASSLGELNGEDLSLLLDRTINVPLLLSVEEIEGFLPSRREDALYEYLRDVLLFDAAGGNARHHALRRSIQRLVRDEFGGDVVKLVGHVDSDRGHVSKHLYNLFSETFLTMLYELYRDADEVLEAQTRLLEWQGAHRGGRGRRQPREVASPIDQAAASAGYDRGDQDLR